jgi:hypothetical protein
MPDERKQPDLRTIEGQLDYLDYHAPDDEARVRHADVNTAFRALWGQIALSLPDGAGKTRALHAVNHARMEANNCIANKGA